MKAASIQPILEKALGFKLEHKNIDEIRSSKQYPPSYWKVMSTEEEMVGSMYAKHIFSDTEGNLVGLNLFECKLSSTQLDILEEIPVEDLRSLNLVQNELSRFDVSKRFTSLVYLNISENPSLQVLGVHEACTQLARLEAYECKLQSLSFPATLHKLFYIDLSTNPELSSCEFLGGLDLLQLLFLRGTAIKAFHLPGHFPELVHLYLNFNEHLTSLSITNPLPKLSTLQLRKCDLEQFSERSIILGSDEIKNEDFWRMFQSFFPSIDSVFVGGNPIFDKTLQGKLEEESDQNNLLTLEKYFKQRESGIEKDNENKVLLIGNGSAGKTNILRRLVKEKFNENWDSTHGINIKKFPLASYDLYFWDFGGQDVYHNTHRLFMQQDAVYILAWKVETETQERTLHEFTQQNGKPGSRSYQNYKLDYWLKYADQLGKGSPMIVAQTNIHEDTIRKDMVQELPQLYGPKFEDGFYFCFLESNGQKDIANSYQTLIKHLTASVETIKSRQTTISSALYNLRKEIRDLQADPRGPKRMGLEKFKKLATDLEVNDPEEELRTWLVKTGVVYHKNGVFDNEVILDQEWIINAIYALFDRSDTNIDEIRRNRGVFTGADLRDIWKYDYSDPSVQELLLGFMKECDICYELEVAEKYPSFEQRQFVAPKLLPDEQPPYWEDTKDNELPTDSAKHSFIKYSYPFLHEKVMEAIIARTAYLATKPWMLWQRATRLELEGGILYVEYIQNQLLISFNHKGQKLFSMLRKLLVELEEDAPTIEVSQDGKTYEPYQSTKEADIPFAFGEKMMQRGIPLEQELVEDQDENQSTTYSPQFEQGKTQPISSPPLSEVERLIMEGYLKEAAQMLIYSSTDQQRTELLNLIRNISETERLFSGENLAYETYSGQRDKLASHLLNLIGSNKQVQEEQEFEVAPNIDIPTFFKAGSTIQLLSASPEKKARMEIDKEFRAVNEEWLKGNDKNKFEILHKEGALDLIALFRAIRRKPTILHFSGHGSKEGIVLMDENEMGYVLDNEDTQDLFSRLRGKTELVILNACHSSKQAREISKFDLLVIGTSHKLVDKAAISFSKVFYGSISDGDSVENAFKNAKILIKKDFRGHEKVYEVWFCGKQLDW